MRPGLLRAVTAHRSDVETVALGKRVRHAGFDLRGKAGKYRKRGRDKRSDSDG